MMISRRAAARWGVFLVLLLSAAALLSARLSRFAGERAVFEAVAPQALILDDDLDPQSLALALERNLGYFDRLPQDRVFTYGTISVGLARLRRAQVELLSFLALSPARPALAAYLEKHFVFLEVRKKSWLPRRRPASPILYTGYYVPTLRGALQPSPRFCYPLYRQPDDLVVVDLSNFDLRRPVAKLWPWLEALPLIPKIDELVFPKLRGRLLKNGTVVPYHARAEIDYAGTLLDRGLELVWVDDEIDRFFLQIQGSGKIELAEGGSLMVGYAAANGHPYQSIGGWLVRQEIMTRDEVSMPSIRAWLKAHPERRQEIFTVNSSYVFFRELPGREPLGCDQAPLTGGRSIATDRTLFPGGALAWIETRLPTFTDEGKLSGWRDSRRLVLNQDTGGAITGPFRVDLYCGDDLAAEQTAGLMKEPGRFLLLLPRE
ncbi:MAG TPA: murein transglycosylase [Proteobacteria bacterium]|nr:murein transglycosylase [Pseudomonadota bacterium]